MTLPVITLVVDPAVMLVDISVVVLIIRTPVAVYVAKEPGFELLPLVFATIQGIMLIVLVPAAPPPPFRKEFPFPKRIWVPVSLARKNHRGEGKNRKRGRIMPEAWETADR